MAVLIPDALVRTAVISDLRRRANQWKLDAVFTDSAEEERIYRRVAASLEDYARGLEETARTSVH